MRRLGSLFSAYSADYTLDFAEIAGDIAPCLLLVSRIYGLSSSTPLMLAMGRLPALLPIWRWRGRKDQHSAFTACPRKSALGEKVTMTRWSVSRKATLILRHGKKWFLNCLGPAVDGAQVTLSAVWRRTKYELLQNVGNHAPGEPKAAHGPKAEVQELCNMSFRCRPLFYRPNLSNEERFNF